MPLAPAAASRDAGPGSRYTLTFSANDLRRVHVTALLSLTSDSIWMSQGTLGSLPEGWATFVHDLSAQDPTGARIQLVPLGHGRWRVPNAASMKDVRVSYDVVIHHDTVHGGSTGAFARGYAIDSVLFFAGEAVFMVSAQDDSARARVRFNLPDSWQAATTYVPVTGEPGVYEADGVSELWENANIVGKLTDRRVGAGSLDIRVVAPTSMSEGVALFAGALESIVSTYTSIMGGTPSGKLLIVASVAPYADGGEAFSRSISLMLRKQPDLSTKGRWAYLLAHEVFHLWNGHTITAEHREDVEWFAEGFTDYMSKLVAYRTGLINEDELLAQLSRSYARYLSGVGKVSMKAAGAEKGSNYGLLYSGGMSVALALDVESREWTGGARGFPDIMRGMYAEFGATHRRYRYEDIVRVASAIAGADLSSFFSTYVAGTALIPVEQHLAKVGLRVVKRGNDISIEKNPTAKPEEASRWEAILRR